MHYRNLGARGAQTPQTEPIPGSNQVPNNAGGYSFAADDFLQLKRLLILGAAGGTYYVGERELSKQHLAVVERLLRAGQGRQVVDLIVEISQAGRAASNEPALFVLARCAACDVRGQVTIDIPEKQSRYLIPEGRPMRTVRGENGEKRELQDGETTFRANGLRITRIGRWIKEYRPARSGVKVPHPEDIEVRQYALAALRKVARTGTHILHFPALVKQFRGWGHGYKRAMAGWYNDKPEERLAYQLLKYQSRDGYAQRDLLRLAHPKPAGAGYTALYHWVTKGWEGIGEDPHPESHLQQIWAFERAKRTTSAKEVAQLVREYKLTREMIPTEHLNDVEVWSALLEKMPMEAMLRNLAKMTRVGLLRPLAAPTREVITRLGNQDLVRGSKLHPLKILSALATYSQGHGTRSDTTWTPLQEIVDALNKAFYLSFGNVIPSGKRLLIAVDVSGSMWQYQINKDEDARQRYNKQSKWSNPLPGLSCAQGAATLALVTAATEPNTHIIGFESDVYPLPISPAQRLDDVNRTLQAVSHPRGTNCALPFTYAMRQRLDVDAVITLTDSETWQGDTHVSQALAQYERQVGHPVKAVNVQMTATHITNFDPNKTSCLECVGFDTATPEIISQFVGGGF